MEVQILDRIYRSKKYPKSIFFILLTHILFQISTLTTTHFVYLYMEHYLEFKSWAIGTMQVIGHAMFVVIVIVGSMLSDNWLGKCVTIWISGAICITGSLLITFASVIWSPGFFEDSFVVIGTLLLEFNGLNCMTSFAGDQFVLPQQQNHLSRFLFIYYFAYLCGDMFSSGIHPFIMGDPCDNARSCFLVLFLAMTFLTITGLLIFTKAAPEFVKIDVQQGIVWRSFNCVGYAVKMAFTPEARNALHWMDLAKTKYPPELVTKVRVFINLGLLFLPFFLYSILKPLLMDEWYEQASSLDGVFIVAIKPYYTSIFYNLTRVLILLVYILVFPILNNCRSWRTPINRLVWGGFLTAAAYFITAFLSVRIEKDEYQRLTDLEMTGMRFYNPTNCTVWITALPHLRMFVLGPMGFKKVILSHITKVNSMPYTLNKCGENITSRMAIAPNTNYRFIIADDVNEIIPMVDILEKPVIDMIKSTDQFASFSIAKVMTIVNALPNNLTLVYDDNDPLADHDADVVHSDDYDEILANIPFYLLDYPKKFIFYMGGVYCVLVNLDVKTLHINSVREIELIPPNNISLVWILPAFIFLALGDILIQVSALEFTYCEAPEEMRVLGPGLFRASNACGQFLHVFIKHAFEGLAKEPSILQFCYASYMLLYAVWFAILAKFYHCVYFK